MQYLLVNSLTYIPIRYILLRMAKIQLSGYQCERCEHKWVPREEGEEPRVCPKCKSPYWNKPRKTEQKTRKRPS
jgi:predicted Zn-ribbon and HTH transcriptional regulator